MSGIVALLSLDGRPLPETAARAQLAAIAHRGDRQPRRWLGDGIALGHVNFPTTPEAEREDLPVSDRNGRAWLVWDGRLDNRDVLARELGLEPSTARAMTDAAYVLAAYAYWGDECAHHLLGDWAIVIWDTVRRRLFCAKDPSGWRQLFYVQGNGMLAVGSEPQQFFAGGVCRPVANDEYVLRYLAGAMQEPGETCYAGVRELEGGQVLAASADGVAVRTYWRGPSVAERPYRRPEEYVDEFVAVFRQATAARLRSNRALGVFLSGGLDSSYVAAVAAEGRADIAALTMYVPGTRWIDERPYARQVVQHLGLRHTELDISDCWALSRRVPDSAFDQVEHPPQSPHMIRLAQTAHDAGVGVVLGGEGGDERMTGSGFEVADALLRGRLRTGWRLAGRHGTWRRTARRLARAAFRGTAPYVVQDGIDRVRRRGTDGGLTSLVELKRHWTDPARLGRTLAWQRRQSFEVEWRLSHEIGRPIVAWYDRHALAPNRIDLRSPFHDLRVVELMAATPEWAKRYNGRPRDILRAAGYRVLPRSIFDRLDKAPFNELVVTGICVRERRRALMAAATAADFPGVRAEAVRDECARWQAVPEDWDGDVRPFWRLISAGLWLQHIIEPLSRDTSAPASTVRHREAAAVEGR